jgi:hypothetical protein
MKPPAKPAQMPDRPDTASLKCMQERATTRSSLEHLAQLSGRRRRPANGPRRLLSGGGRDVERRGAA